MVFHGSYLKWTYQQYNRIIEFPTDKGKTFCKFSFLDFHFQVFIVNKIWSHMFKDVHASEKLVYDIFP